LPKEEPRILCIGGSTQSRKVTPSPVSRTLRDSNNAGLDIEQPDTCSRRGIERSRKVERRSGSVRGLPGLPLAFEEQGKAAGIRQVGGQAQAGVRRAGMVLPPQALAATQLQCLSQADAGHPLRQGGVAVEVVAVAPRQSLERWPARGEVKRSSSGSRNGLRTLLADTWNTALRPSTVMVALKRSGAPADSTRWRPTTPLGVKSPISHSARATHRPERRRMRNHSRPLIPGP
jgi:hypothetical protein